MKKKNIKKILLTLSFLVLIQLAVTSQEYTFYEVKEILMIERPQTGDENIREACITSLDNLVVGANTPLSPEISQFYKPMVEKAIQEIIAEPVTEGASIWQLYNHGFVVKTPSSCFGFDLYDYYNLSSFKNLASVLDVYFISHQHGDHKSNALINQMISLEKPVVAPSEWTNTFTTKMEAGDTINLEGLEVTAHYGLHSVAVRQFEVETSEGIRILHTGDNQTSATLPYIDNIDILLINGWVNESGSTSHITGVRNSIEKLKPALTLPGHILELGHVMSNGYTVPFEDMFRVNDINLYSDYCVLAWGERYHLGDVNDTIIPADVSSIIYQQIGDSLILNWEAPEKAEDGDTACFYRIIHEGDIDKITSNRIIKLDVSKLEGKHIYKFYAYDDCGNQSQNYKEIEVDIVDVNMHNPISAAEFNIYPNPVQNSLTIKTANPGNYTFEITSVNGQLLLSKELTSIEQQIDLSFLQGGIYYLTVSSDCFVVTRKVVKY